MQNLTNPYKLSIICGVICAINAFCLIFFNLITWDVFKAISGIWLIPSIVGIGNGLILYYFAPKREKWSQKDWIAGIGFTIASGFLIGSILLDKIDHSLSYYYSRDIFRYSIHKYVQDSFFLWVISAFIASSLIKIIGRPIVAGWILTWILANILIAWFIPLFGVSFIASSFISTFGRPMFAWISTWILAFTTVLTLLNDDQNWLNPSLLLILNSIETAALTATLKFGVIDKLEKSLTKIQIFGIITSILVGGSSLGFGFTLLAIQIFRH